IAGESDRAVLRNGAVYEQVINFQEGTRMANEAVIDCDGHILEPPDMWDKYLEPKYRERGIHIRVGDDGVEYLELDRKRAVTAQRALCGSLGGSGARNTVHSNTLHDAAR